MTKLLKIYENQKGAAIIIVAILLPVLIGFAALAVDVGYMYATRNELQNAADAAALAGATQLGAIYLNMSYEAQQTYNVDSVDGNADSINDRTNIETAATDVSEKNRAAGNNVSVLLDDIRIGQWDFDAKALTETADQPDAVTVVTRRDASANGPVSTFFASILNMFGGSHDVFSATARATAALSGPAIADTGDLNTPFGISANTFPINCTDTIEFSPTTDSCAAWHNFFENNADAADLGALMLDIIAKHPDGPQWLLDHFNISENKTPTPYTYDNHDEVATGDLLTFNGGKISSVFEGGVLLWNEGTQYTDEDGATINEYNVWSGLVDGKDDNPAPMIALFDFYRMHDGDENDATWKATVPVYQDDGDSCSNPTGDLKIVGFANIEIIKPCTSNKDETGCDKSEIKVKIDCNFVTVDGLGGGGQYGNLKGSIPNLVQ